MQVGRYHNRSVRVAKMICGLMRPRDLVHVIAGIMLLDEGARRIRSRNLANMLKSICKICCHLKAGIAGSIPAGRQAS